MAMRKSPTHKQEINTFSSSICCFTVFRSVPTGDIESSLPSIISAESNMFCQGGENYCHRLHNIRTLHRVEFHLQPRYKCGSGDSENEQN